MKIIANELESNIQIFAVTEKHIVLLKPLVGDKKVAILTKSGDTYRFIPLDSPTNTSFHRTGVAPYNKNFHDFINIFVRNPGEYEVQAFTKLADALDWAIKQV